VRFALLVIAGARRVHDRRRRKPGGGGKLATRSGLLLFKSPDLARQSGLECVPVDLDARKPSVQVFLLVGSQFRRNVDAQPSKDGEQLVPDVLAVGAAHDIVDGVAAGREAKEIRAVWPHCHL
jgi:hypothetical protein